MKRTPFFFFGAGSPAGGPRRPDRPHTSVQRRPAGPSGRETGTLPLSFSRSGRSLLAPSHAGTRPPIAVSSAGTDAGRSPSVRRAPTERRRHTGSPVPLASLFMCSDFTAQKTPMPGRAWTQHEPFGAASISLRWHDPNQVSGRSLRFLSAPLGDSLFS